MLSHHHLRFVQNSIGMEYWFSLHSQIHPYSSTCLWQTYELCLDFHRELPQIVKVLEMYVDFSQEPLTDTQTSEQQTPVYLGDFAKIHKNLKDRLCRQ